MRRIPVQQRPDLEKTAREHGYDYSDGVPYWDETAYYRFTLRQIEDGIERPAREIDTMCFQLLDRSVADETIYRRLGIPEAYWDYIAASWKNREKDLSLPFIPSALPTTARFSGADILFIWWIL